MKFIIVKFSDETDVTSLPAGTEVTVGNATGGIIGTLTNGEILAVGSLPDNPGV
ncbi:MAG: hypothetical protein PHC43_00255 [Candidatus Marinimicrobia bacterium]|jgi:hypothetical protein|nr:hypothetical protein [Candidatus Neomarinimicrobiota bacterium]